VSSLVIWRFSDGKAGHDNQSRGLCEALARLRPVDVVTLAPLPSGAALLTLLRGRVSAWRDLPAPDLLLGTGHGTHLSLLAARRSQGGRTVVLMRPSLPLRCFDLCLIPEHDAPPRRPGVLVTRGVLNRIQPSAALEPDRGLLLIGGPSSHFDWDDVGLQRQITRIVAADPTIRWVLTTSRRTPPSFLETLTVSAEPGLTVVPVTETGPDWLPAQLARASRVWASADSVSMVYEALTAGAAVGVLDVPSKHPSRVGWGLRQLAAQGWVTPFTDWQRSQRLSRPDVVFNEAERCARWMSEQWFV